MKNDYKAYYGNIYKATKFKTNYTDKQIIENSGIDALVGYSNQIVVPKSINSFDDGIELYKEHVLMIKLSEYPLSDFIVLDLEEDYKKLHSYPMKQNDLFVDENNLTPYLEDIKVSILKLAKCMLKKYNLFVCLLLYF